MKITLAEIAKLVDGKVVGDENLVVTGLSGIQEAKEGELTFLADKKFTSFLETTNASAVILPTGIEVSGKSVVYTENPSLAFSTLISELYENYTQSFTGVDETAVVGDNVSLGKDVVLAPYVVIEDGASIGDDTVLMPGVFIGKNTKIGKQCFINANASVYYDTVIGNNVIIHSGSVIGSDGYGYTQQDGKHHKIPQIGNVVIEDDVEIGANVAIDRARLNQTLIRRGTKIDNLVQIAHNVDIGEAALIISQVGISGSVKIGKGAILAGQAGVAGHLEIGDGAIVAAQGGVTKSVPSGEMVSGYPAKSHKHAQKVNAALQNLPDYVKTIRELKNKVEELEKKINNVS